MRSYKIIGFGNDLEARDEPTPTPCGSEVLVEVTASGVCHSDLHLRAGYFDFGGDRRLDLGQHGMELPFTLGHEVVGTVAEVGPDAGGVAAGDRRIVYPWIGCGKCADCLRGDDLLCAAPRAIGTRLPGGYATHLLVPHPRYLVPFDGLDEDVACTYACSGITAFSALKKAGPLRADQTLVVIGAGGVGMNAILQSPAVVDARVVVADADPAKREAVRSLPNVVDVVDNTAPGAARHLLKRIGGAAAAIDFVGRPETTRFGFDILRRGGRLVVVGLFGGEAAFPIPLFPLKAATVTGSYVGTLTDLRQLVGLAQAGRVPPLPVRPRALDDVNDVLHDLEAGRINGRVVLKPGRQPAF